MATKFFTINNISNLHVGSGNANYGVIDNLVQKDVNTELPTIHSSGIKGALREFFKNKNSSIIKDVFGEEGNDGTNGSSGKWKFLSADLLSRPVRSDKIPYFNAASTKAIELIVSKANKLGVANNIFEELEKFSKFSNPDKGAPVVFEQQYNGAKIEENDWKAKYQSPSFDLNVVKNVLGSNIVLIKDEDYRELELPVIARNHLENGKSQNLWYEEVVPYNAFFGLFIITDENHHDDFYKNGIENKIVQIGANASISYGLCQISEHI
ncbi:MAG: type III-B CRISPR module RAMP protein Cmr4 [Bacteroidales bacterium]|nr:type III-B CRISPR module RAMP protein Cmr4 [Bacteroidales bacterium]